MTGGKMSLASKEAPLAFPPIHEIGRIGPVICSRKAGGQECGDEKSKRVCS
jgi:hypothetical protein